MLCIILVFLTGTQAGHLAYNTSDVITTYMGHADALPAQEFRKSGNEVKSGTDKNLNSERVERFGERKGDKLKEEVKARDEKGEKETEGVDSDYLEQTTAATEAGNDIVFIPSGNNDAQSFSRRLGGGRKDEYSVKDMMERVAIGDVIQERIRVETEAPVDGIYFKPGKNNEITEEKIKHERDDQRIEQAVKEYKEVYENPMDCENLDCENVVESVCGVKLQNKRPKHRLFMNECYFRKVNCGLRYEYNNNPCRAQFICTVTPASATCAKTSYKRAMTANTNGLPCDHTCPVRCPDEYAPVCAYTFPKQARVFQNHCLLDLQSCNDGSVWQERALAECAGDVRAEVHERAAFIGWMQRMGILDKKGHLVM